MSSYQNLPISPRGMIHTVAVFVDVNATGLDDVGDPTGDTFGDSGPDYQPVTGLEAVPCRVIQRTSVQEDGAGKTHDVSDWHVMFRQTITLDGSHQLQWTDTRGDGLLHKLNCRKSDSHHGKGHHTSVDCDEVFD